MRMYISPSIPNHHATVPPNASPFQKSNLRGGLLGTLLGWSWCVVGEGATNSPGWAASTAANLWPLDDLSSDQELSSVNIVVVSEIGLLVRTVCACAFGRSACRRSWRSGEDHGEASDEESESELHIEECFF
jgi:hypothetical protein